MSARGLTTGAIPEGNRLFDLEFDFYDHQLLTRTNCGDWVMVEGYSRELSSCGFRPGGGEEGAFYAYALTHFE